MHPIFEQILRPFSPPENGAVVRAADAYEREIREIPEATMVEAEQEALLDVDTVTDWLSAECAGLKPLAQYPARSVGIRNMSVPQLLALMMGGDASILAEVRRELRSRYLAAQRERIVSRALDMLEGQ